MREEQADADQEQEARRDAAGKQLPAAMRRHAGFDIAEEFEIPGEMIDRHGDQRGAARHVDCLDARRLWGGGGRRCRFQDHGALLQRFAAERKRGGGALQGPHTSWRCAPTRMCDIEVEGYQGRVQQVVNDGAAPIDTGRLNRANVAVNSPT